MESPQLIQAIIDTAQGLICCLDVEGRISLFNKACQKLTGYSEEEVLGRHLWDVVIPPEHIEERRRRFALLKQGHISGAFEATWLTRHQGPRQISWLTAILRDSRGQISGVVATGVDITERRMMEAELEREQAFVRALINELPDGLIACDERGELKLINRRAREFHGEPFNSFNLYDTEGRLIERDRTPLLRALSGEQIRDCEIVLAPKDRRARYLLCAADPLLDDRGSPIGAVVQMHDDTERRAAEQSLRQSEQRLREQNLQLECLFGLARDLTQTLDRGKLRHLLDSAVRRIAQLLGADNCRIFLTSVEGEPLLAHQASNAGGVWQMSAKLEQTGGHIQVTQSTPRSWKESENRWLEAAAGLIGNAIARVGIIEDLAVQKERALEASQAKTRFLANMSHEIRTPLNGVLGLVQILLRAPDVPDAHQRTLDMVRNCGAHLLALVNDILDLSRIESGRLEFDFSAARVPSLLKELSDVFVVTARERGLSFRINVSDSCPAVTVTDERRLRQVLFNLIGNALKFTMEGEVGVEVSADGEWIRFDIADTGPGIDTEQLARLFEPFERGAAHHSAPGAGLGLAISARIAEGLGGRIEAQSTVGQGSRFTLFIPNRQSGGQAGESLQIAIEEPRVWFDKSQYSPAFLDRVDALLVPAIQIGDLDGIASAVAVLRRFASRGSEAAFLEEVAKRAEAFDIASLYPLTEARR